MHIQRQAKEITEAHTTCLLKYHSLQIAVALTGQKQALGEQLEDLGKALAIMTAAIAGGDRND